MYLLDTHLFLFYILPFFDYVMHSQPDHFLLLTTSSSNITVRRKQSGIPKLHVPPEHVQNLTDKKMSRVESSRIGHYP